MKKLISFCVILALTCSLVGCAFIPGANSLDEVFNNFRGYTEQINNNAKETEPSNIDATDPVVETTENIAPVPVETEPEADDHIVNMDSQTQHKINLFLSNFAEARITEYPCCNYHKLSFVISHCEINGVGDLEYAHGDVFFSKSSADSILNKYTGSTIKEHSEYEQHQDCKGSGSVITFSENFYYCPAAAGAPTDYVAIVDRMLENGDGTYTVHYRVYYVLPTYGTYNYSELYKYSPAEAAADNDLTVEYSAEAIVKDYVRSNGQESYQLISLKIV